MIQLDIPASYFLEELQRQLLILPEDETGIIITINDEEIVRKVRVSVDYRNKRWWILGIEQIG